MKRTTVSTAQAHREPAPSRMRTLVAGKYELGDQLASVGPASAYRARHALLDADCTVTVLDALLSDDAERLTRVREAVRRACRVRHEHVVPVLDLGEEDGSFHVVEGAAEAAPLRDMLERGPVAPGDALRIARQLADALSQAHAQGVVHGAVSPANILVRPGTPPCAFIAGFSVGILAREETVTPSLLPYTTPERLAGEALDARTDVFALGLVLFEMIEGRAFLSGEEHSIRQLLLDHSEPLLPQFGQIMPAGVSALVARAIRRKPAERQQSMTQMREEIDACLRRLGERALPSRAEVVADEVPAKPRKVMVVDDTLDDADEDGDDVPARPVAGAAHAATARPFPAAVVVRVGGRKGPKMPVTGKLLMAAVVLALSWPVFQMVSGDSERPAVAEAPAGPETGPVPDAPAPAPAPRPAVRVAALSDPVPAGASSGPARSVPASDPAPAALVPAESPMPMPAMPPAAAPDLPGESTAPSAAPAPESPAPARNVAPRIVSTQPRRSGDVTVMEGGSMEFAVQATDANADDTLAYAWFLDGRQVGKGPGWRFVAPLAARGTEYTVEVRVSDAAGLKAPRASWTVEVTPRMTDANVRNWLGRLTAAWASKDVASLRIFGVVRSDADASAVRTQLGRSGGYRVSLTNPRIRLDGSCASVSVERTDFDGRGRVLSSARESYELLKLPSGFIALSSSH